MRKLNENGRRRYNLSDLFSYIQDLIFEIKKIAKFARGSFLCNTKQIGSKLKEKMRFEKKITDQVKTHDEYKSNAGHLEIIPVYHSKNRFKTVRREKI